MARSIDDWILYGGHGRDELGNCPECIKNPVMTSEVPDFLQKTLSKKVSGPINSCANCLKEDLEMIIEILPKDLLPRLLKKLKK